jgi:hypothetical protein
LLTYILTQQGTPQISWGRPVFVSVHVFRWFIARPHAVKQSFANHSPTALSAIPFQGDHNLARSNYKFQKRQKELARKKKKEEKRQRKQEKNMGTTEESPDHAQEDGEINTTNVET